MIIIWLSYHVIWQSKSDLVIWHIYDRYMTGIWHRLSYDCHIPVISLDTTWCHIDGTYRHIPVIWHRELTSHMKRSSPQQNRAWNAAAHRVWIARVFIVPVHHSTRRCHWAAVTASLGQATAAEDDAGGHKVAPPTSAAVVVSWLRRAALAADCRVHKQMTSVGIKMN